MPETLHKALNEAFIFSMFFFPDKKEPKNQGYRKNAKNLYAWLK